MLIVVVLWAILVSHHIGQPSIQFDRGTASDLRLIAFTAWEQLGDRFGGRLACAGDVTVVAVSDLDDQGRYSARDRRIEIRVPIYESTARNTVLHELGHHLEQRCPDQSDVRSAFIAAQGMSSETAWFGPTWEESPSEMWAEAVSLVVSGEQQRANRVPVAADALRIVAAWADGA
jgi:hypothetical protein